MAGKSKDGARRDWKSKWVRLLYMGTMGGGWAGGVLSSKVTRSHFDFEKTMLAAEVSEMPRKRKAGAERKGRRVRGREMQV